MFGIAKSIWGLLGASILAIGSTIPDIAEADTRHRPGRPGFHKPWPGHRPPIWPGRPPGHRPPLHRPPAYRPPLFRPPAYRPPIYRPPHRPIRPHYRRWDLPEIATFSVVAGVTYAIVDNLFYKKQGDQYIYVEQPPVNIINTTVTTSPNSGYPGLGTVIHGLPLGATSVVVNGVSYYVAGGVWYAPMAGTNQFIVVSPQA